MEEHRPLLSDLLAHRRFLDELALRLTGQRDGADELVQETWLIAIERPPRHAANLPAWLKRVLRQIHYRRKDRERRSKTTELDPALPASESGAEESLVSAEISRRVAELVLELDEPFRSVVLLRFYEGKTPTQIAAQLDRPVNTITSQLSRALERLRAGLDRLHDGDRSCWTRAMLPLATRSPRANPGALPRRPCADTYLRVGLSSGVLLSTGLLAVLVTILVAERRPSSEHRARAEAAPALADRIPSTDEPRPREPVALAPEQPSPALADASPAGNDWVDLEVVDAAGAPITAARIYATRGPVPDEDISTCLATHEGVDELRAWSGEHRTDSQGSARVDVHPENAVSIPAAGEFVGLVVESPGFVRSPAHYVPYPRRSREPIRVSLERTALSVRGRVIDPEGAPARALVFIGSPESEWIPKDDAIVIPKPMGRLTDQGGNFELDGLAPYAQRLSIQGEGFLPLEDWVDEARASQRFFVLQRGATVSGVVTMDGHPVAGARVSAEFTPGRSRSIKRRTTSDADGAFEITAIGGLVWLSAQHPDDPLRTDATFLRTSGCEQLEWSPELDRRPPLRVRVLTDDGRPLAQACMRIHSDLGNSWCRTVVADDEGLASISGLAVANHLTDVFRSEEEHESNFAPLAAGRTLVFGERENLLVVPRERLERGALAGRVVATRDQLRMKTQIIVRPIEGKLAYPIGVDRSTGNFRDGLGAQPYMVVLFLERLGVVPLGVHEVRANETLDLGSILVPTTATVDVDWRWPGEGWQYSYKLVQLAENGGWTVPYGWIVCQGQGPISGALQPLPGRYEWSVWRDGAQVESQILELRSDSIVRVSTGPATSEKR